MIPVYKFAGFINFVVPQYQKQERLQLLTLMGKQLSCRSSNEQKYFDNERLSLVFRPLSMGITQEEQQQIWNKDKNQFCLLDGRIYNHLELRSQLQSQHQFRTNSDAEIILQLYEKFGAKAINYLNGTFAIVIWDAQKQELFLARDRLGIKPLYYTQVGSQLIFGSNLKSLLVHPDAPNQPQWLDLTVFNPTSSYVKGIDRLPGGHYFTYLATEQTVTPQCYWDIRNYILEQSYSLEVGDAEKARQLCDYLNLPFHPVFFDREKFLEKINFSLESFEYFIWLFDIPRFELV